MRFHDLYMSDRYDVITIGGGLGGSALAYALARAGLRVLVLERETKFKDRVRGEQMSTWGVADAQALGILDLLKSEGGAQEMSWWDFYFGPMRVNHRNLIDTTPAGLPNLCFFHPRMQEALIAAAEAAGADVRRGARVTGLQPGAQPSVAFEHEGRDATASARLVVAADGRNSAAARWTGFERHEDRPGLQIAGLLMEHVAAPEDTGSISFNTAAGTGALVFPQGEGVARTYLVSRVDNSERLQGEKDVRRYLEGHRASGGDPGVLESAKPAGPLATFDGADSWVPHPYRDGVALVGDAAATSDPAWGQGLSLTVRDVRTLRDALLREDDWNRAGHAYADEHDRCYHTVHTVEGWFATLFYDNSADGDARRARAMPLIAQDRSRIPDSGQSGPDTVDPSKATRRRFFGED
jgi:menaquinone-9 beta-reductase